MERGEVMNPEVLAMRGISILGTRESGCSNSFDRS